MSDGITVQVVGHETGKENNSTWTRVTVVNSRGRFNAKFWGAKATNLTRDLVKTLQPGETIATKRLFVELKGEFETFTKDNGYKIRYFKAEDYEIIDGPSLELARTRGEALSAINNSEALRNAGALAQAYKNLAAYVAELAHLPLDLSEMMEIEALTGKLAEDDGEGYNPEAAAAAHYLREEAMAEAKAVEEDAAVEAAAADADGDLDEIILSASEDPLPDDEANLGNEDGGTTVYSMLNALREPRDTDASEEVADEASEDHGQDGVSEDEASNEAEAEVEVEEKPTPAPVRRFGFNRR